MSLLSKKNKLDTIHLDYEVRVLPAINDDRAYYLIREIEQFVNDNIFRVLSDRDYAANCLWYIFSYWMEHIHREGVAVIYDPPQKMTIAYLLISYN